MRKETDNIKIHRELLMEMDKKISEKEQGHFSQVVRSCKCDFCGKEFDHKPYIGGNMREKKFCSYHCQENDYMQYHDYFSDADSGL